MTQAFQGTHWILLRSFGEGQGNDLDEAIGVRLDRPLKVGCNYHVGFVAGTDRDATHQIGQWIAYLAMEAFPSDNAVRPPPGAGLGDGFPVAAEICLQMWAQCEGAILVPDQPYQYLFVRAAQGYHIVVDEVNLTQFDQRAEAAFNIVSTRCGPNGLYVDGSGSTGDIEWHYWEICEGVPGAFSGCWPPAGTPLRAGRPTAFEFPVNIRPCRSYQVKLAVIDRCCIEWKQSTMQITAPGVPPPANLEGWWTGDRNTLNFAKTDHNGTWEPTGAALYVPGKVNDAFSFSNSTVQVPDADELDFEPMSQVTIDAWIKTSPAGMQPIVHKLARNENAPCLCPCNGDQDGDGDVDQDDLNLFNYCLCLETNKIQRDNLTEVNCDINCDGVGPCMDQLDYLIMQCQFAAGWPDPACCIGGERGSIAPLGYEFFLDGNRLALTLADDICNEQTYYSASLQGLDASSWHHVAVTVNRNQANGGRFFFDGQPIATDSGAQSFNPTLVPGDLSNGSPLRIGAGNDPNTGFPANFFGNIDELELFRRALSSPEIAGLYAANNCGKCRYAAPCGVPKETAICVDKNFVDVRITICNYSADFAYFDVSVQGLAAGSSDGLCTASAPQVDLLFASPVFIEPGRCRSRTIRVFRPLDLIDVGDVACFSVKIRNESTGEVIECPGRIRGVPADYCPPPCSPCAKVGEGPGENFGRLHAMTGGTIGWELANTGQTTLVIPYRVSVETRGAQPPQSVVSLNGLPPSEPVLGTITISPGDSPSITAMVRFTQHLPTSLHHVTLEFDPSQKGSFEIMSSVIVYSFLPAAPCPESSDLNSDGEVDEMDLAIIQGAIGLDPADPKFNPMADLDSDGLVTLIDYQIWWACYQRFSGNSVGSDTIPVGPVDDLGDLDADGVPNEFDNCPNVTNPEQADEDGDGRGDSCDACPATHSLAQVDTAGCPLPVDVDPNCDGVVDHADIAPFIFAIMDPIGFVTAGTGCSLARVDANRDSFIDSRDIQPFVMALLAGT
ncbi:MAG TPA: LamG-like jellyroll fold domain-containing protein [Phycisphaerae bacterium]|nr:LamG-like jellyroll fold domain-containing protein [Phycisphaerae bacterium]